MDYRQFRWATNHIWI